VNTVSYISPWIRLAVGEVELDEGQGDVNSVVFEYYTLWISTVSQISPWIRPAVGEVELDEEQSDVNSVVFEYYIRCENGILDQPVSQTCCRAG
jgi:hypothetical protein